MNIKAYWLRMPKPGNLGDMLTPWIIQQLGHNPVYYTEAGKLLCIGSIIGKAREGDKVWGAGIMSRMSNINVKAKYYAVRGKYSRDRIIEMGGQCPEVYGDPALLLPRFYNPEVRKLHKLGFIPHYVDYEHSLKNSYKINILNRKPLSVVDEILKCEKIVSSSLHGIIIAQAYGIPAKWVRLSDSLCGDDIKFEDYASSVGIKNLKEFSTIEEQPDMDALLEAFPYASN